MMLTSLSRCSADSGCWAGAHRCSARFRTQRFRSAGHPAPRAPVLRAQVEEQRLIEGMSQEEMSAELLRLRQENQELLQRLQEAGLTPPGQVAALEAATAAPPAAKPVPAESESAYLEELESGIIWPTAGDAFWEKPMRKSVAPVPPVEATDGDSSAASPPAQDMRPLHVMHVSAEMAPIAKVGGLGDVVTGLARACLEQGHHVEVVLPYYECLPDDEIVDLKWETDFEVPKGYTWDGQMVQGTLKTSLFTGRIDGCPVLLIRPDWDACNIFRGGRIYGGSYNEIEAYLFFCRAALEMCVKTGRQPNVLHLHEWQAAAVAMLYWEVYHYNGLARPRVMLTIHNLDNTGEVRQDEFTITGVPGEVFASVEKALDERTIGHNPERLNLVKGGIVYSNFVTTVSPTYADEAMNGNAAGWLKSTLAGPGMREKFKGVLNGIDVALWDPASDTGLPATYTAGYLRGKALCKRFLQEGLGLDVDPSKPLVTCISRLVPQKGIHLIRHSIFRTIEKGGQFVLLGSGHCDGDFRALSEGEFRESRDARIMIMYNETLAHAIYAAADVVVVPSMFEPCGLTQMVAMRYGAVPVVRRTGGLADTVLDVDSNEHGNGYTFDGIDEGSLDNALDRALECFRERPEWWQELMQRNMRTKVSWKESSASYIDLYKKIAQF